MRKLIEDLWYGNIAADEKCGVDDPEIAHLTMLMKRQKDQLNRELGLQQKDIFEKYADCTLEYACLLAKCAFCDGFALAAQLMAEALSK